MFKKIDFAKAEPVSDNGKCKWYLEPFFNDYIRNRQADNLPALTHLACFVAKGKDIEDLVLINNNEKILKTSRYNFEGFDSMQAFINVLKISQHYDENEI